MEGYTVYEVLALGYKDLLECRSLMAQLEGLMSAHPPVSETQLEGLLKQYADLQERFQQEGGYEMDARIQQVANGLCIPAEQFNRPYLTLSGGEKTKVGLGVAPVP